MNNGEGGVGRINEEGQREREYIDSQDKYLEQKINGPPPPKISAK